MRSIKRLTKVTITADIFVEDIRSDRAGRKLEKAFIDHVACKPYVGYSTATFKITELDPETGEPNGNE